MAYSKNYFTKNLKETKMKEVLAKSLKKAMDYNQYQLFFKQLATEGRSTGESTPEKINFTKLNFSRSKRLDKTINLSEEQKNYFQDINEKQTWLVITEPWCGDAAQSLPFLNKIAERSENIVLKIVLRDENPELMDAFLTNGSRSIPKLIVMDKNFQVINHWGSRSKAAAKVVDDYIQKNGQIDDQLKTDLQIWYNKDKGESILQEIQNLVDSEMSSQSI